MEAACIICMENVWRERMREVVIAFAVRTAIGKFGAA